MALTELQRRRTWEAWYAGEVRANYFADLAGRYRWRQSVATFVTLFASSGAFVALVAQRPTGFEWVPTLLTALTAAVSVYAWVAQNQQRALDGADLHYRWNRLASEYQALWDAMYAEDSAARLAALDERAAELSKVGHAFPVRPRLIRRWHAQVAQHHAARRAA